MTYFFTIYATVSFCDYLEKKDQKILTYFVRVCQLSVSRIVEISSLNEIHQRLIEVISLIEQNYERNKITLNLHLSVHLSECSYDYEPLYAFWCFLFERMNGILSRFSSIFKIFYIL